MENDSQKFVGFTLWRLFNGEVNDNSDIQLLRDYAEGRDEAAFREIVTRHTDFVYSAALRQMGSSDAAADVAQSVFVDLARKAESLADDRKLSSTSLAGWLHRATRFAVLNQLRDARRRVTNERQAMQQLLTDSEPSAEWDQIRPLLDEALDTLGEDDREALLLRYFKNHNFRDVGLALGISDDAAQKRVSRAVERLREVFSKWNVTIGATGLVVLISANAVQSAPAMLATTISAAALSSAAISTSTAVAATKAIAMTTLQKALITATVAVLAGAGVYEARQAAQMRDQVQTLQQQQAPLVEQIQQLQNNFADATNRLADLLAENQRLKANPERIELLKLRGELTRLRNDPRLSSSESQEEISLKTASKSWLARVNQLKQYIKDHPNEAIPEFQFLDDRAWLVVADAGLETEKFETESDFDHAMQALRFQAGDCFGHKVTAALRQFSEANNGKFPDDFSELASYCSPEVLRTLGTLYEIKPASFIPDDERKKISSKFEWFITRKIRATTNTTSRLAILADGYAYWQSRP